MWIGYDTVTNEAHEHLEVDDYLTQEQIAAAFALYPKLKGTGTYCEVVRDTIIVPNLASIEQRVGQKVDPDWLAERVNSLLLLLSS